MSEVKHTIAMIGAGPASLYATEVLAKAGHHVVILNRDIKPGGLAEFGIYPTKHKMKTGLRKYFQRILGRENVHYFGDVSVGVDADISLEEIRGFGFDAVVVAVGAQGTKWLGLPGEEADAVFHAKDLVYHYNGLPPFSERDFPIGSRVAVVGLGNVCLDIVHWVVCEEEGVDSVTAIARRGPAERKFTKKEYKLVSGALDTKALDKEIDKVAPQMEAIGQDPEAERKKLFRYIDEPLEKDSDTSFRMRFLRSPVRIEVDDHGQVEGIVCEKTRLLEPDESGRVGMEGTQEFEKIDCNTVVFAIGDAIEPSLGLPLSPRRDTFATVPESWDKYPDRPRYMVYDPEGEEPMWDTFVVGWARKASDGLVGKARADAVKGCDEILAYLQGEFAEKPDAERDSIDAIFNALDQHFQARDHVPVRYDDVERLIAIEEQEAQERDVVEFKFRSHDEMLRRLGRK